MTTITLLTGQVSPITFVPAGSRVTMSGSGSIEWTPGNPTQAATQADWQTWSLGTTAGHKDTIRPMCIRATATGDMTVTIDEGHSDDLADGAYWDDDYVTSQTVNGQTVLVGADGGESPLFTGGVAAPGTFPTATDSGVAGNPNGTYYYAVTYYTASGETDVNTAVPTPVTVANKQVSLTGIPVSSESSVIGRYIWRNSAANGNSNDFRKYQLVADIADNTTTTYTDNIADASLGRTIPSISTTRGSISLDGVVSANMAGISTVMGEGALSALTGYSDVAIGYHAMNANTSGIRNTAIGVFALQANTTGDENTAVGVHALHANLTGRGASAIGFAALQSYIGTTQTNAPTAIGYKALTSNTTSQGNTAVGTFALTSNITGEFNTAIGGSALQYTTTTANTGIGFQAGFANAGGTGHTVVGAFAGLSVVSGNFITAVGYEASKMATGTGLTSLGYGAGKAVTTGSNSVHIGFLAGAYDSAGNSFYLDGLNRTDVATGKTNSMMYGVFNTSPILQTLKVNAVFFPLKATTAEAPAYVLGGVYFDTTLNKLRIGGATGWETVTSA